MSESNMLGSNLYSPNDDHLLEVARSIHRDRMLFQLMKGLFPDEVEPSAINTVLDIGCGPGA